MFLPASGIRVKSMAGNVVDEFFVCRGQGLIKAATAFMHAFIINPHNAMVSKTSLAVIRAAAIYLMTSYLLISLMIYNPVGVGIFGHFTIRFRFWESRSDSRTILDLLFSPLLIN